MKDLGGIMVKGIKAKFDIGVVKFVLEKGYFIERLKKRYYVHSLNYEKNNQRIFVEYMFNVGFRAESGFAPLNMDSLVLFDGRGGTVDRESVNDKLENIAKMILNL
ncbi:MAG: hypothetical protein M0Q14_09575 [Tissierellaceae bacterium]|nr:hypothetical protein [Tissierellaceae bacterium]